MDNATLIMPISGVVCRLWIRTSYDQPTYQIWSLCLHLLRKHKKANCRKRGSFGYV